MTDTNALGPWECFQDASYYDMWCVRRVHDRTFGQGFHLMRGEEAAALRDLLNTRTTNEHPNAEDYRNRAERDAEIARLEAHAGHLEERAALYRIERALIIQDREINEILQRRLKRGKWFIGSEGYVLSTALTDRQAPGCNDADDKGAEQ